MTLLSFNVHGLVEVRQSRIWSIAWAVDESRKNLEVSDEKKFDEGFPEIPIDERYFLMFSADIEPGGKARIATRQLQKLTPVDLSAMPEVKAALKRITNKMARAAGFPALPIGQEN